MTDQEILSTIFTSGDTNDNYIDISGGEISTAQLIEPTLAVTQMNISEFEHKSPNNYPERLSFRIPLVSVNDYTISQKNIVNFNVDYSSFLPTMMVEFYDTDNAFLSTAFPREGSTMQLYIGGHGDELYYKPIRQDFIITNISRSGNPGSTQQYGGTLKYKLTGTLSVPGGSRKESWCDQKVSARQALFNLSVYTGLGFATNFIKDSTFDTMQWNNEQNKTLLDFMKSIANHAFYSQYSFFTSFIDQYYVFNFIECHSLLSHGGKKTDTPAMIYANIQQASRPENEVEDNTEKKTENEIVLPEGDEELSNMKQQVSYYFLTNNSFFSGWSNYIEVYSEINNGSSSLNDGYRVHLAYADSNAAEWGCRNCEFVLAPIDNLKRDGSTHQISELPEEPTEESYIPLNLTQTTNHVYLDTDMSSPDNLASMESYISVGEVDTTNTFKHYYFAKQQNDYQMRCLKKCGLHVKLQNYNPSITKFSRVWVDIFSKNKMSFDEIKPSEIRESWTEDYQKIQEEKNDNILYFETEGENGEVLNEYGDRKDPLGGVYNRALSGWYVVTEMKIVYNRKKKNLQTELTLNRIEYKPNLKTEYDLAKRAIKEKYRYDNTMGSWFNNMDYYEPDTGTGEDTTEPQNTNTQ